MKLVKSVVKLTIFDKELVTPSDLAKALEFDGMVVEVLEHHVLVTKEEMDSTLVQKAASVAIQKRDTNA